MIPPPPADQPVKEAGMPFQFTCNQCGIAFTRPRRDFRNRHVYCSRACRALAGIVPLEERFWSRVDKDGPLPSHCPDLGPCWTWTGSFRGPYGRIWINGKTESAHRLSWAMANGRDPGSLFILHACDNTACVNPAHLNAGTPLDNMRERTERGRAGALRGEAVRASKLLPAQVIAIRQAAANGETQRSLAARFDISQSQVGRVVRGRDWRHVGNGDA